MTFTCRLWDQIKQDRLLKYITFLLKTVVTLGLFSIALLQFRYCIGSVVSVTDSDKRGDILPWSVQLDFGEAVVARLQPRLNTTVTLLDIFYHCKKQAGEVLVGLHSELHPGKPREDK